MAVLRDGKRLISVWRDGKELTSIWSEGSQIFSNGPQGARLGIRIDDYVDTFSIINGDLHDDTNQLTFTNGALNGYS